MPVSAIKIAITKLTLPDVFTKHMITQFIIIRLFLYFGNGEKQITALVLDDDIAFEEDIR